MAEIKHLVHINLGGNQLLEAAIENLAVAPTGYEGRQYFNTVSNRMFYYNGTSWVDAASDPNAITAISTTTVGVTVDDADKADTTVEIATASGATQGLQTSAQFTLVDNATSDATVSTLVQRDAAGAIKVTAPTDAAHATTKAYVDNLVSSGMTIKGAIACAANPNYPVAIVGDTWHVSSDGLVGGVAGEAVKVGDVLICVTATAAGNQVTVGSSWIIVERNNDQATTVALGNVRFATAGEITAGTATDVAVTPADVTSMVGSAGASYTVTLASGSTSYTVTHSLGGVVQTSVYNKTTGDYVQTDVSRTDDNVVVIDVNVALAVDHAATCVYGGAAPA